MKIPQRQPKVHMDFDYDITAEEAMKAQSSKFTPFEALGIVVAAIGVSVFLYMLLLTDVSSRIRSGVLLVAAVVAAALFFASSKQSKAAHPETSAPGRHKPSAEIAHKSASTPSASAAVKQPRPPKATPLEGDERILVLKHRWVKWRFKIQQMIPFGLWLYVPTDQNIPKAAKAALARLRVEDATNNEYSRLSDLVPDGTFGYEQTKGGGGTTTTLVNDATEQSVSTFSSVTVLDTNPASGTCGARLGKRHSKTITVQQLFEQREELGKSHKAFIRTARPNNQYIRVIGASSIVGGTNPLLDTAQIPTIMGLASDNTEYLFVDTANVVNDAVALAIVQEFDVIVFTANAKMQDSLRQLGYTMESLRTAADGKYRDKVNSGVVVITNILAGKDLEDYRWYLNLIDIEDDKEILVEEITEFAGPFQGIPHDPVIALDKVVNRKAWKWETQQAYRELGIARLRQLCKVRGINPDPDKVVPVASQDVPDKPQGSTLYDPASAYEVSLEKLVTSETVAASSDQSDVTDSPVETPVAETDEDILDKLEQDLFANSANQPLGAFAAGDRPQKT